MSTKAKVVAIGGGIALALGLVLVIGVLSPKQRPHVVVGYQANVIYLPIFVAHDRGYFEAEGLEVDLRRFQSANEMMQALKLRKIEFTGMSSLSVVARQQAVDPGLLRLITLERFAPEASPDAIVVHEDSAIQSLEDLRGHLLGTWQGSTIATYTRVILLSEGFKENEIRVASLEAGRLDPNAVNIMPMGKGEMLQLFKFRRVEAIFTFEPAVAQTLLKLGGRVLERAPLANRLLGSPTTIYPGGSAVLSSFARENREAIDAFRRAYRRAIGDIEEDWQGSLEFLKGRTTLDDDVLKAISRMGWVVLEDSHLPDLQRLLDFYAEHGITDAAVDASTLLSSQ